ncbi:MAG: DUF4435 domain-containing protein [Candidatus Methanomethylophilaceae archaeon]|jgi:hypothetical protein
MRDKLTSSDIANEISMLVSATDDTVLVVEGITDSRLYGKFCDRDRVRMIVGHSKDNVRRAVDECWKNRGCRRIVGIVDADLDRLIGKVRTPPVFQTDKRDLEMMLISSPALDYVLAEYSDTDSLAAFESEYGPVLDAVVSASYPVGLLMYVSHKYGLNLSFRELDFDRFVNHRTLEIDVRALVDEVICDTAHCRAGKSEIMKYLKNEIAYAGDPIEIARGHDAVEVLLIALKNIFGSFNSKNLREGELSGSLRLAFDCDAFADTNLFRNTSDWAEKEGFRLWSIGRKV